MIRLYINVAWLSLRLKGPTAQRMAIKQGKVSEGPPPQDHFKQYYSNTLEIYKNNFTRQQLENASQQIKRVFSLSNATPSEILKFRISQAVKKYQSAFNDHGSSAVQVAVMTQRIIFLMIHTKKYPKDTKAARYLVKLLDQRRKMMAHLIKTDYHRFQWICTDYGIPPLHPPNANHSKRQGMFENTYRKIF